jgi:tape measure domain-containing protein
MAQTYSISTAFKAVDRISGAFIKMGRAADSFGNRGSKAFDRLNQRSSLLKTFVVGNVISAGVNRAIGALSQLPVEFKRVAQTAQALKVSFDSVFGKDAANQMKFVEKTAFDLGLGIEETARGYQKIAASAKGTSLEGEATKNVFLGVSKAATALQLTSEQSGGALLALSQVISKGKVQAEELRGQLGERIPGAFQIAARAMGMTTAELDKFMSDGKLTAEKFIPAFAKQLEKEFGGAAEKASKSFQAAENRFQNTMFFFKRDIGSIALPALAMLFTEISKILQPISKWVQANQELLKQKVGNFVKTLLDFVKALVPWITAAFFIISALAPVVLKLAPAFLAWQAAILLVNIGLKGMAILGVIGKIMQFIKIIWMMAKAKGAWVAVQWALNAAMSANPIGLIVIAVAALIGLTIVLVKNWDKVKAAFLATIPVFRMIGKILFDALVFPIKALLQVLSLLPGVGDLAKAGIQKINEVSAAIGGETTVGETSAPNETQEAAKRDFGGSASITVGASDGAKVEKIDNGISGVSIKEMGEN